MRFSTAPQYYKSVLNALVGSNALISASTSVSPALSWVFSYSSSSGDTYAASGTS